HRHGASRCQRPAIAGAQLPSRTPRALTDLPQSVPRNGQPMTMMEIDEHEAIGYRAWGTPIGEFLARHIDPTDRRGHARGPRSPPSPATFSIATHTAWSGSAGSTITATYDGVTRSADLRVDPDPKDVSISNLSFSPSSVAGGASP